VVLRQHLGHHLAGTGLLGEVHQRPQRRGRRPLPAHRRRHAVAHLHPTGLGRTLEPARACDQAIGPAHDQERRAPGQRHLVFRQPQRTRGHERRRQRVAVGGAGQALRWLRAGQRLQLRPCQRPEHERCAGCARAGGRAGRIEGGGVVQRLDHDADRVGTLPHHDAAARCHLRVALARPEGLGARVPLHHAQPQPPRAGALRPGFDGRMEHLRVAAAVALGRDDEGRQVPHARHQQVGDDVHHGLQRTGAVAVAEDVLVGAGPAGRQHAVDLAMRLGGPGRFAVYRHEVQRVGVEESLQQRLAAAQQVHDLQSGQRRAGQGHDGRHGGGHQGQRRLESRVPRERPAGRQPAARSAAMASATATCAPAMHRQVMACGGRATTHLPRPPRLRPAARWPARPAPCAGGSTATTP